MRTLTVDYISDLHLDFRGIDPSDWKPNGSVLLLAGDVVEARQIEAHRGLFEALNEMYELVIPVAGNHEFYGTRLDKGLKKLREFYDGFQNFRFLENDYLQHRGVVFYGGTCWTNFNRRCPISMMEAQGTVNDYRRIEFHDKRSRVYRRLLPSDVLAIHQNFVDGLKRLTTVGPLVVVSHHAPSPLSITPRYRSKTYINGAYFSDLSDLIFDKSIHTWVHGHMHWKQSHQLGDANIRCNPRGYPGEHRYGVVPEELEIESFNVTTE